MEKIELLKLWKKEYGNASEAVDYAGRVMNIGSDFESLDYPVISLIRPFEKGGMFVDGNIVICSKLTELEKNNTFPTWKANGQTFQAKRVKGTSNSYIIEVFL